MKTMLPLVIVLIAGFTLAAGVATADVPATDAGLVILGKTDDFLGPMARGDFNGDGVTDLALGAPGT